MMFTFINPWNFIDREDWPEIPELSEKGFKILVGVEIVCALAIIGGLVYLLCFL